MKSQLFSIAALTACTALCGPVTGNNRDDTVDPALGILEEAAPPPVGVGFVWGEQTLSRTVETQTMFIRHKATEYQRRIAERNAKAFFAQLTPAKKQELKRKHIRTVLISTVRSRETSPEAKEVRMRYSLEGESLIDDYTYEVQTPLQTGTVATLRGQEPEYVGL